MNSQQPFYSGQTAALIVSSTAFGVALIMAPLVRTLPEPSSIWVFMVLAVVALGCSFIGVVLGVRGIALWQSKMFVVSLVLSVLGFAVFIINLVTPWLWPYAQY